MYRDVTKQTRLLKVAMSFSININASFKIQKLLPDWAQVQQKDLRFGGQKL